MTPMLSHQFAYDIHIFDTDCYGVVWHGAYTKWLEMGRVDCFKQAAIEMQTMSDEYAIVFPVVEQTVRFKASARLGCRVRLETQVRLEGFKFVFEQTVTDAQTGQRYIEAKTLVVMVDRAGKLYRQVPEVISERLASCVI